MKKNVLSTFLVKFSACKNNHLEVINKFPTFDNVEIDARDIDGLTPLYYISIYTQNIGAVEILYNFGAQMEFRDKETKRTLLHLAAMRGEQIVVQFLGRWVNVNVKDLGGNTALHLAVVYGHLDVVGKLISFSKIRKKCEEIFVKSLFTKKICKKVQLSVIILFGP